jgi:hypothetical protein
MTTTPVSQLFSSSATANGKQLQTTDIADSSAVGRALLTAVDVVAQRAALGLPENLTNGVQAAEITDSTPVGRAMLLAADAVAQRALLSMPEALTDGVQAADITDSTALGRSLMKADAPAFTALLAGTHVHTIAEITSLQVTLDGKALATHTHAIADVTNLQPSLDTLTTALAGKAETADLASTTDTAKGSSLVAFLHPRANAAPSTVRNQLESLGLRPELFNGATPAIRVAQCIAAAKAHGSAPIYLPTVYDMAGDGLTIDWPARITGPGGLRRTVDVATPLINIVAGADRTAIDGVQLDYTLGGATASALHAAIRASNCADASLLRNIITGKFYVGINDEGAVDIEIVGNRVRGAVNRAIYVYLGGRRVIVTGNIVDGYVAAVPATQYGINVNDGGVSPCLDMVITGNVVRGTTLQGIEISGSSERTIITNNALESSSTSGNGLLMQFANGNRGRKALVSQNSVKGWGNAAHIFQFDNVVFADNQLAAQTVGLLCSDSTGVTVTGNNSHDVFSCHYWYVNVDGVTHNNNTSRGGSATFDVIADANCDRLLIKNNQRHGGAGNYSLAATNLTQGDNV